MRRDQIRLDLAAADLPDARTDAPAGAECAAAALPSDRRLNVLHRTAPPVRRRCRCQGHAAPVGAWPGSASASAAYGDRRNSGWVGGDLDTVGEASRASNPTRLPCRSGRTDVTPCHRTSLALVNSARRSSNDAGANQAARTVFGLEMPEFIGVLSSAPMRDTSPPPDA